MIREVRGCSLVNWDKKISAVVFCEGCNFRCEYCYNKDLWEVKNKMKKEDALTYLAKLGDLVDGVVITGGEPCIWGDELISFLKALKDYGFAIKLDTNGSFNAILEQCLMYVDYVAMDIKWLFDDYERVAKVKVDSDELRKSANMLMDRGVDYEFRTTILKWFTYDDVIKIAEQVVGAKKYCLQGESGKRIKLLSCQNLRNELRDMFDEVVIRKN